MLSENKLIKSKSAAPGYALAPAKIYAQNKLLFSSKKEFAPHKELTRWKCAHEKVNLELQRLQGDFSKSGPKESAEILGAHLMMLQDPEWIALVKQNISQGHLAEYSVQSASESFASMVEALNDPYLRERAQDIRDVSRRVIYSLSGEEATQSAQDEDYILFAEDLMPSELLSLYGPKLKGVVLTKGNPTSHTSILARTFELPMLIKVSDLSDNLKGGTLVALDGVSGTLVLEPDAKAKEAFEKLVVENKALQRELEAFVSLESKTLDGHSVDVASNLNSLMDLDFALRKGSEGVGLFRTEFLLMDRKQAPTEQEQYEAYKKVLKAFPQHKVVIRTFDIGGDKQVSYLNLPKEDNPFLGLRGIRYTLTQKEFFKIQIRALLRASVHGKLAIMAPMVSCLDELLAFKEIIEEVRKELEAESFVFTHDYEIGIMVEVPSIALVADQLSDYVDFLSVGTNDLIQYLCAADRMNSAVADLHDAYHPALLKLLKTISDGVKGTKTWLGICGELAAKADYIPLLLAMGFSELSVSPGALLKSRKLVRSIEYKNSLEILKVALSIKKSEDLRTFLMSQSENLSLATASRPLELAQ